MTPQLPKLTPEQEHGLRLILDRTAGMIIESQGWHRTCLSCLHFNEATEQCTFYVPAMRPPARVIVEACPAWDGTPF